MNPLKIAIFNEVRKTIEQSSRFSDDEFNKLMFHHPDGLRLTLKGFLITKSIFTAYSFEMPETIKTRHRFGLSKLEYPYFFTKNRLILFSEMDATMVKLHGGIESFLENCSQFDT